MQDLGAADARAGIVFVLDQPRDPANIGAVVRLLGNFGLTRLRLVDPPEFADESMLRYARRGEPMIGRIERHASLDSALADCSLVLGTTRRRRTLARPVLAPRQAALALLAASGTNGEQCSRGLAAVLFGPEDFGLANAALDRCHAIVTIPTAADDASLNLAQAAAIVAYEVLLAASPTVGEPPLVLDGLLQATGDLLAVNAELERLFDACRRLLIELHDPPIEGRTAAALARMRALLLRAAPREDEARLLTTVFEHAAHELARRPR